MAQPSDLEAKLVGVWGYGSKPTEYQISEGLNFEGPNATHGTVRGQLLPKGGWLQAALQSEKGEFAGHIRLQLAEGGGEVISQFKGAGRTTWGGAITAHKRPPSATTGDFVHTFSAGQNETMDGSPERRDGTTDLQRGWKNLMVATGRSAAEEKPIEMHLDLGALLETSASSDTAKESPRSAASSSVAARPQPTFPDRPTPPAVSRSAKTWTASPNASAGARSAPQGRRAPQINTAEDASDASSDSGASEPRRATAPGAVGSSVARPSPAPGWQSSSLDERFHNTASQCTGFPDGVIEALNTYSKLIEERRLLAVNFRPGIKVRECAKLTSRPVGRYPDQTILELMAQQGTRMQVRLCEGSGPDKGWISSMIDGNGVLSLIRSLKEFRDIQMAGQLQPNIW